MSRRRLKTAGLYRVEDAAIRVGLAPGTIRNACSLHLIRDRDFIVRQWRYGVWERHERLITRAGLQKLFTRSYRTPEGREREYRYGSRRSPKT